MPENKEKPTPIENKQSKYETVRDNLNTRENSTLVVATVASSASLILLTTTSFHCYALVFALLGILYRELTIFSSDRRDHAFLRDKCPEYHPNTESENPILKRWDKGARPIRSLIVRVLLALPIIIFYFAFVCEVIGIIIVLVFLVFIEECMLSKRIRQMFAKIFN